MNGDVAEQVREGMRGTPRKEFSVQKVAATPGNKTCSSDRALKLPSSKS